MLLMMLLTTATAWADGLTDFLPVSSSGTATGYFTYSNHFYRVDWSGINTSQTSSVRLTYDSYGALKAQTNGDTSNAMGLSPNNSMYEWKTFYITGLTPGQSSDGYTSYANLATGAQAYGLKKVCTVTCIAANAPTWAWSADCTTCTATFTCTDYPSLTTTVNATVTLSGITATASVTFNGTDYSDSKIPNYSITYVLNGGTNAAGNPSTYTAGTGVASLANPTRTGYTFSGWYDNPGFTGSAVTCIPASTMGPVTLYAKWTANQYMVVYNANGGSGTMSNQTFTYDVAQQLRTNTFTYTGKLFDGWKDGNNNSYSANQSVVNLTATNNGTVTLYAQWKETPAYITGSGTASDPYIISSTDQWNTFADESNSATYWGSGTHIQLGANISGVTTMVGTNNHRFGGTFDGQGYTLSVSYSTNSNYCAPFCFTDGATIKKLNVAGTITTSKSYAAGLISYAYGTTNISDCRSSVTINSSVNGRGYHAGFIAVVYEGSTTNITNCVFDGSINGNTTKECGGFVNNSMGTTNISNSLLDATFDIDYTGCYTFTWGNNVHIENSYYITALGTVQGTQAYTARQSFPCKSATILGTTVYYAADLTPFGKTNNYSPDGSADYPYIISTAAGWEYFCDALQDNDTWNRFSGKTVKLGANIGTAEYPITRMAGSSGHDFCGTFDGYGNTLTFMYGTVFEPATADRVAPFSYISNVGSAAAVIRRLNVVANIITTGQKAGGIVGEAWGKFTIEHCTVSGTITTSNQFAGGIIGSVSNSPLNITDCRSSVTISSSVSGDGTHGGFAGRVPSSAMLNISGCVFDGKIVTTNGTTNCGGFVGHSENTAGTNVSIVNSLYTPAADANTVNVGCATFGRNVVVSNITNCYYTRTLGTEQGKQAHSITAGENVTVSGIALTGDASEPYSVSGITTYSGGGISCTVGQTTTFYYGQGDVVSLTLGNTPPTGYTFDHYTASGGTLNGTTLTMPDGDVTINAAWTAINYSITYHENGGEFTTDKNSYTIESADITLDVPSRTGYTFDGWYPNEGLTGDAVTTIATGSTGAVELWAKWTSTSSGTCGDGVFWSYDDHTLTIFGTGAMWNGQPWNSYVDDITMVDIRSGVTSIGDEAFYYCRRLNYIEIPASVTSIGDEAFYGCDELEEVWVLRVESPITQLGSDVFDECTALNTIYVPTDKVNDYKDADNWKDYKDYIKGLNEVSDLWLDENYDNSSLVAAFNGEMPQVILRRRLYKDGDWNTLCLPFDVVLEGSHLAGAEARTLTSASITGSTLNLTFSDPVDKLTAGTPYIIKWAKDTEYPTIYDSNFPGVTIDKTHRDFDSGSGNARVRFLGTYEPIVWETENKSILFLGTNNKLYYPQPSGGQNPRINAFRAYFQLGDGTNAPQLTAINLNFDDGEQTGIRSLSPDPSPSREGSAGAWYDMQGRKLDAKPTKPGLYINNGKKIVIK